MRLSLLPILLILPLAAHATVVTTHFDEDNGSLGGGKGVSLREAVKYGPAGDTITFAPALSGQTIRLVFGHIRSSKSYTIDGSALPVPITLSGDKTGNGRTSDDTRILWIDDAAVSLHSLTFSGASAFVNTRGGGAIYASGHQARLTINTCTFTGNHYGGDGGAIYFYGAYNTPEAKLTVHNSTFTGNTAIGYGGAIYAMGEVEIQNTTITGNEALGGGGITIHSHTTALILHATITGNAATSQGGCAYNSGSLTVRNSIIGGNTAPTSPGIYGSFVTEENLSSDSPLLASLGDYGGPTQTMPPLHGSPAIDANGVPSSLTTDQRGFPRVSTPDIGAVEFQGTHDVARFWNRDFDGDGSPYGVEQALGTRPDLADLGHINHFSGPTFLPSGAAVLQFGFANDPAPPAAPGTHWVLKRSPELSTGSFVEIYRYTGSVHTAAPGITFQRSLSRFTVTDESPPPGSAFYRFEAVLDP